MKYLFHRFYLCGGCIFFEELEPPPLTVPPHHTQERIRFCMCTARGGDCCHCLANSPSSPLITLAGFCDSSHQEGGLFVLPLCDTQRLPECPLAAAVDLLPPPI